MKLPYSLALWPALLCIAAGQETLTQGVWQSKGYGYIFQVAADKVQIFETSSAGCVKGVRYSAADFYATLGQAERTGEAANYVLVRPPTRDEVVRLAELPQPCRKPLEGGDAQQNLAVLAATFAEYYPFFAERKIDWTAAVARAEARLREGGKANQLFPVLVDLLKPLQDGHVTLSAGKQEFDPDTVVVPGTAPDGTPWSWRTLRVSLREFLQSAGSGMVGPPQFAGNRRLLYGRLPNEIGYVAILAEGAWAEGQTEETPLAKQVSTAATVLDEVLGQLQKGEKPLRGMVVDLRVNSGGFDGVAMEIASRFCKEPQAVMRKSAGAGKTLQSEYTIALVPTKRVAFTGPVAVLIGTNTVSAGETAAGAFAALPNVRLLGQPTRGILSDAMPKHLPNGWEFTLSIETLRSRTGELLEVNGVQPQQLLPVPATSSPEVLWSGAMQAATEWLNAQAQRRR